MSHQSLTFGGEGRGCGGNHGEVSPDAQRLAAELADRLDDWKSLAFYRKVAASLDHNVIRDALHRALDVPRRDLRRSRAAYFTALIRPYVTDRPARSTHA